MYFLISSSELDDILVQEYSRHLPACSLVFQGGDIAVYVIGKVERGARGHVYELSKERRCNHLFFEKELRHFHDYKLLVSDMDSTLISIECIDVMAGYHGCADEVSRLTAEAMAGHEQDYRTSLVQRVRLLAGFAESRLPEIYDRHVKLNPGADQLLEIASASGMYTTIVSGGFTYFTGRLCEQLGMSSHVGNELEVHAGILSGELVGDLVDGEFKAATLQKLRDKFGFESQEVIALGDGANDLPMMQLAGLAVGYRPKRVVGEYADAVLFGTLDRLPYMLRVGKEVSQ